jgi:hypothetical protein
MHNVRSGLVVALASLVVVGAAAGAEPTPKRDKLEGIALVWKPTTRPSELGPVNITGLSAVRLQVGPFTDGRANPASIGQNREEPRVRKVSTVNDVPAFVADRMRRIIAGMGIATVDAGGTHVLKGEVKQFFVDETSRYQSEVVVEVTLTNASGKTLWTGSTNGSATRFGRSYKADNYFETLSDALLQATFYLVKNPTFHDALAKP